MRLLGLFDRPMGLKEKQVLCEKADYAKPLAALNDDEFQALEKRLENAGLLLKSDKSGIRTEWDCHPLIRNYFGQIFRKEEENAFQQAHRVLFDHYQAVPGENYQPDRIEELEPLYRAVVHGCLAGEYQKALDVYKDRILRRIEGTNTFQFYSFFKLGAYAQDLTVISTFFPDIWEAPLSKGLSESNQAWLVSVTSFCLNALGCLMETVEVKKNTIKIYDKLGDWNNASINVNHLIDIYLSIGSLKDAEHVAQQAIVYADRTDSWQRQERQVASRARLATTLHRQGHLQESLKHFQEAEKIQQELQPQYPRLYNEVGASYCNLLLDMAAYTAAQEAVLERGREFFKWRVPGDSLLDISLDHLTIARALFALNRFDEAYAEFDEAVRGIRKAEKTNHTPYVLLARAKFYRHQKQFPEAWHDLDEAKDIIERCGMKLYAVDANLLEGNLFLDKDDGNEATKCYKQAKELIEYTGYHLRDAELELLAARLAHFEKKSEKTKDYLNKSYQSIERIGYWGFLAEWERVRRIILPSDKSPG